MKKIFYKARNRFKRGLESSLIRLLHTAGVEEGMDGGKTVDAVVIPLISGLGDAVVFSACLHRVADIFPNAEIVLMANGRTGEYLELIYPQYTCVEMQSLTKVRVYRNEFDLMILPFRNIRHYLMALILKPKRLVGYNYSLRIHDGESHIRRANRILNQLGYDPYSRPEIELSAEIKESALRLIETTGRRTEPNYVSFIIGGRWASKVFPPAQYRMLADRLVERCDTDICLIGTDRSMGESIAESRDRIMNFAGKTSVKEVLGLIYHSHMVVGPDGGLLNIAVTLNKPILGFFGPVDPLTVIPQDYKDQIMTVDDCEHRPCYNEEHEPICVHETYRCMDFDIEGILKKFETVYAERVKKKTLMGLDPPTVGTRS